MEDRKGSQKMTQEKYQWWLERLKGVSIDTLLDMYASREVDAELFYSEKDYERCHEARYIQKAIKETIRERIEQGREYRAKLVRREFEVERLKRECKAIHGK